ncbi:hypothetical protein KFL_012190010 [Klebsormidium nitens]|uniref:Replication origin-binding protein domain-containing protein n=1 Tax=Klebsormidium nitens TaxID=105231 RepID=A0A1Y1IQ06_KLENI|nr:hypothetical protein KFL_012190010 [Klebsormidium nitens]|eukprot:GAQ92950.1 hypothetical protein KFL_012190010 [Klebsormidium nitens]
MAAYSPLFDLTYLIQAEKEERLFFDAKQAHNSCLVMFEHKVPSSRRILQNVGGKRLASEASAGNCSQRPTWRRGLVKKRRCVILSQESKEEQPVDIGPPVDRVRATDRSQESGFAQGQAQTPGRVVVHTEQDGAVQTVQENKLGTAFFSKLSRAKLHYQDPKNGPQGFSKRYAALCDHTVELHLLDHKGYRSYGSYQNWPTARDYTSQQPFLEEVLVEGKPCKPFLDMERDRGLPQGENLESVISQFEDAITKIFAEDYAVEIQERDFNWVHCDYGPGGKFSVHLVISTHGPRQLVFRSNLAPNVDPQGAGHLARRLAKVLPPTLADLIDQSVYTRNRGIRMPGCAKPSRPNCPLRPLDPTKPYADSVITWFDEEIDFIKVPVLVPDAVRQQRRPTKPAEMAVLSATNLDAYTVQRCLELLQARLHPTAYKRGASRALNFSWTDREGEPCYTGHTHSGVRDLLCVVNEAQNAVFAKCSSERKDSTTGVCCKEQPAHYLGRLYEDVETWKAGAIEIDMRYLERDPLAAGPMDLQLIRMSSKGMTDKILFNNVVNRWQAGEFQALLVRSPMGTGKSELVKRIKAEEPVPQKILLVTYRQTQASDAHGKNPEFAHYADLKALPSQLNEQGDFVAPLADRVRFPKVIVQVDSLYHLLDESKVVDSFDLVILDESESNLAHLSADTLSNRHRIANFLIELLCQAKRIIALDGHLAQRTFDFLTMSGIPCGPVVINNHLPERTICD